MKSTRKVVHRSPWRAVRLINLPHLQPVAVEAESTYERDFVYRAALYPYLKSIQSQPFRIEIGSSSYTPDFLLGFQDGSQFLVEVKPKKFVARNEELFHQVSIKLEELGIAFRVVDEDVLHRDDIHIRVQKIRRYAKHVPMTSDVEIALRLFDQHHKTRVKRLGEAGVSLPTLLSLIASRRLQLEADLQFNSESLVSISQTHQGVSHAIQFDRWLDA